MYDARALIPFDGHTNASEVEVCVDVVCRVAPDVDAKVCDLGCGTGWHLLALARRGYSRLYGLDVSMESLAIAANRCANTRAIFICGDVCATGQQGAFDVVTIFNAALGSGQKAFDLAFLRGAASRLVAGGTLVMSYIPRELASRHVGTFDVAYCKSSSVQVSSSVNLRSELGVLEIRQRIRETLLPTEILHLYTMREMNLLVKEAGLDIASIDLNAPCIEHRPSDAYLGWIVARKSSGQR